jgi:hypothetical protein
LPVVRNLVIRLAPAGVPRPDSVPNGHSIRVSAILVPAHLGAGRRPPPHEPTPPARSPRADAIDGRLHQYPLRMHNSEHDDRSFRCGRGTTRPSPRTRADRPPGRARGRRAPTKSRAPRGATDHRSENSTIRVPRRRVFSPASARFGSEDPAPARLCDDREEPRARATGRARRLGDVDARPAPPSNRAASGPQRGTISRGGRPIRRPSCGESPRSPTSRRESPPTACSPRSSSPPRSSRGGRRPHGTRSAERPGEDRSRRAMKGLRAVGIRSPTGHGPARDPPCHRIRGIPGQIWSSRAKYARFQQFGTLV